MNFRKLKKGLQIRQTGEIRNTGRTVKKMPRQPRGGGEAGADFGTLNYSERLNVAITGNKTMKVAILAINQRTYRAIVSFAAE